MKNLYKNNYLSSLYLIFLGALSSFSLPPYNYFIINFLTFSLFFIFLINKNNILKKKFNYFKYGWLFGFGYFFTSLYWVTIALTFDENLKILIPASLILIPSFLAIFYGCALYVFSFFKNNNNISLVLTLSILLGTTEFIRGNILTGFPWNLFVFSFSNNLEFIQILSVLGTYSLNTICITFFLIPAIFILRKTKIEIFFCLIFILIGIFFLVFGNIKLNDQNSASYRKNDFVIKVVSSKIDINRFYIFSNEQKILEELIKLSAPDPKIATIFIWPEGILSSTNLEDIKRYKNLFLKNFSDKHLIILGINHEVLNNDNIEIFNSLAVVDKNLNVRNLYYKNKLVPFGEFLPFENFLSLLGLRSITHGYQSFSKGKIRDTIDIEDQYFSLSFLPLICYEIIYSGQLYKDSNFDFIVNISEDGWFGSSVGPHQHFVHSIFRSIEEGKNIIRSSNNGISANIDSKGRIIKKIESTQGGVIEINNTDKSKKTIFLKNGNNIFFYLLLIYISFICFINKRRGE
ncbi:apolipoprotein N-acyltransferase [Candidatus Pelagibacter sp.]|nr:apolipoprotein N-acyltransferase [Candidatus Pelagibacter sp.]